MSERRTAEQIAWEYGDDNAHTSNVRVAEAAMAQARAEVLEEAEATLVARLGKWEEWQVEAAERGDLTSGAYRRTRWAEADACLVAIRMLAKEPR